MNRFLGFIIKEFYHIFRDYRTMIILFGMPVIQILLFGYVLTNEIKDAKIAIYDQSKDNITKKLSSKILSSGYFISENEINNTHDIEEAFKQGSIKIVIIYEAGFADKLNRNGKASVQIIADASEPNTANLLVNYTQGIIADFVKEINPLAVVPMQIKSQVRMRYNPDLNVVFMFVPGVIATILMLICSMITSIAIVREKEAGTMEVLLVSPLNAGHIIIGKVIPYIVLSFSIAMIVLALGNFVFAVPVKGSLLLLLGETLLFIIVALSLGILVSTISKTQQSAMLISLMGLLLPTILLSGFIIPVENMPVLLQWISEIIPAKWFVIILRSIMIKGCSFDYIWKETLILGITALLFIAISVTQFKTRLE
mgnify:CR=1 FL=1